MPSALIIGASRGLGLGMAREWRGRGWDVVATRRGAAPGLDAVGAEVHVLDIDDVAAVQALAETLAGRRFDVVLLNAGVTVRGIDVHKAAPEDVARIMWTNAAAPIRAARYLEPLVADGGVLAFMSSIMGSVALRNYGYGDIYSASKAALNSLTRGFAADLKRPLAVVSLHPGWVKTDMGGPDATLDIEDSCRGMADTLAHAGMTPGHRFIDYRGETLAW